jgi:hypothetical protein
MDGFWSSWSNFTECSTTCGKGTQTRKRTCDNPPPDGGQFCRGNDTEIIECIQPDCPGIFFTLISD